MNSQKNEKIIIDKPYGQVVIKKRDTNVIKKDLEFERFFKKCEVTYDDVLDNIKSVKVSYKYIDKNGKDNICDYEIMIIDGTSKESIDATILRAAHRVFKIIKSMGVNV